MDFDSKSHRTIILLYFVVILIRITVNFHNRSGSTEELKYYYFLKIDFRQKYYVIFQKIFYCKRFVNMLDFKLKEQSDQNLLKKN